MKKELKDNILCLVPVAALMAVVWFLLDGWLRPIIMGCLYLALLELLYDTVRVLYGEPKRRKRPEGEVIREEEEWYRSRQDPVLMEKFYPVGWALTGISAVVGFITMLNVGGYRFFSVVGILCSVAAVALCSIYPAYFSLCHSEGEKNRKVHFPIINVLAPFAVPLFANAICSLWIFSYADWMKVLEVELVALAVLGVATTCLLPEFRRHRTEWTAMMVVAALLVFGVIAPLNTVLEMKPPQVQRAVVTEYHDEGSKAPPYYVMELADGTTIDLRDKGGFRRRDYAIGQTVEVEFHQGGLGMAYYCYHE